VPPPQHPQGQGPAQVAVDAKYHHSLGLQLAQPSLKSPGDKKRWWTLCVYPWRSFSLLLVTSSSATGTPLKGSYTVTLNSLGLVEGNTTTLPSAFIAPTLVSSARHQAGASPMKAFSVVPYKRNLSKRHLEVIK